MLPVSQEDIMRFGEVEDLEAGKAEEDTKESFNSKMEAQERHNASVFSKFLAASPKVPQAAKDQMEVETDDRKRKTTDA